jgi:hypothetical protein
MANMAEQIAWQVHPRIDYWRKSKKIGSVVHLDRSKISLMFGSEKPNYADFAEVAKYLECEWGINPLTGGVFFIPHELFGEER